MPDPASQPHVFVRPGQIDPGHPAPDACVFCGQPEAAHGTQLPAWHVMLHSGADVTSYVIRAEDELTAAARAGAQHGAPVDGADVEPWDQP
jgi:hypothetical protein